MSGAGTASVAWRKSPRMAGRRCSQAVGSRDLSRSVESPLGTRRVPSDSRPVRGLRAARCHPTNPRIGTLTRSYQQLTFGARCERIEIALIGGLSRCIFGPAGPGSNTPDRTSKAIAATTPRTQARDSSCRNGAYIAGNTIGSLSNIAYWAIGAWAAYPWMRSVALLMTSIFIGRGLHPPIPHLNSWQISPSNDHPAEHCN